MEMNDKGVKIGSKNNKVDLFLKKHVGLIHCENKLTLVQRKICNILLFNALDEIKHQDIHQISLKQLCSLVGYNSNDIQLIKDAIKNLISVIMEWNLLDDNKLLGDNDLNEQTLIWNASSLLAGASIKGGLVSYSYSPQMKTILNSLDVYGRINLFVQSKFKSNYSLVLYENCVRFKNIKQTSWFPLKLFRSLMGVTEDKYKSFKEFKRNVITHAMKEVNQKSDIFIEAQYRKSGRNITAVQFLLHENERYQPSFKKLTPIIEDKDIQRKTALMDLLTTDFKISQLQAEEIVSSYKHDYVLEKISIIRRHKKIKSLGAYLTSALKKDYQKKPTEMNTELAKPIVPTINLYQRESKEASEIRPLRNKYLQYKLNCYRKFVKQQSEMDQINIKQQFEYYLQNNSEVYKIYQKKNLTSPFVMGEYITFLDKFFPEVIGEYQNFDDYITSEA